MRRRCQRALFWKILLQKATWPSRWTANCYHPVRVVKIFSSFFWIQVPIAKAKPKAQRSAAPKIEKTKAKTQRAGVYHSEYMHVYAYTWIFARAYGVSIGTHTWHKNQKRKQMVYIKLVVDEHQRSLTSTPTHAHMHTYTKTHRKKDVYVYIHMYMYMHVYIYTQT